MADVRIEPELGHGAYGHVYRYSYIHDPSISVAVKQILLKDGTLNDATLFAEIHTAPQLHSQYIVHVLGNYLTQDSQQHYLLNNIMEYCDGGNLQDLHAQYPQMVPEEVFPPQIVHTVHFYILYILRNLK